MLNLDNILYINKLLRDTEHFKPSDPYGIAPDSLESQLRDLLIEALQELHFTDAKKFKLPDEVLAEQDWHEDEDEGWIGDGWSLDVWGTLDGYEHVEDTACNKHSLPIQARFRKVSEKKEGA
jgi:hypothetical protein